MQDALQPLGADQQQNIPRGMKTDDSPTRGVSTGMQTDPPPASQFFNNFAKIINNKLSIMNNILIDFIK